MKVLGIIPSRYASSRFPGKPLIDLKGQSMIQRVYLACIACELFDEVIVATDDQRIFDHVKAFEGKVMMTAQTHQSGTDRCAEVLNKMETPYDVIINVQGDEPLVQKEQFSELINCFKDESVEIATLAKKGMPYEDAKNRNRVKVVVNKNNNALYFSRSSIPFQQSTKAEYTKHIGLYAFRSKTLLQITKIKPSELELSESLEQLRWMENGYSIRVAYTTVETPNIDSPDDVEKVLDHID
jgi:3-deoxy-manno-octulosonate cytidylyltransferase (CMP-KDO synthetase)